MLDQEKIKGVTEIKKEKEKGRTRRRVSGFDITRMWEGKGKKIIM